MVARELGLISRRRGHVRLMRHAADDRPDAPSRAERHVLQLVLAGQTAAKLTAWPVGGGVLYPFLSSIDNGWLGAALRVVMNSDRGAGVLAGRIFRRMRWDMFYNPDAPRPGGLIHGGFWDAPPAPGQAYILGNHIGVGPDVYYTTNYYDTDRLGDADHHLPRDHHRPDPGAAVLRDVAHVPRGLRLDWQESQPAGVTRTYLGIDVYEGAYAYRGMRVVPGWGGSMFEELMPDVFVPEATWAPRSWGLNHPLHIRAQREHGLVEAGYGYWGFSPSSDPFGGYREYGVDRLGMNPTGYYSDKQNTNVDIGFGGVRPAVEPEPDLRRRRRHAPRVVPRDDARAGPGLHEPRQHPGPSSSAYALGRLPRRGGHALGHALALLLLARPGHGHGRAGERARRATSYERRSAARTPRRRCVRSSAWRSSAPRAEHRPLPTHRPSRPRAPRRIASGPSGRSGQLQPLVLPQPSQT